MRLKRLINYLLFIVINAILLTGCFSGRNMGTIENRDDSEISSTSETVLEGDSKKNSLCNEDVLESPTYFENIYYVINTQTGLYGLYDCDKEEYIVKPIYEYIGSFSEDELASVSKDGYYGYIDKNGKIVIDFYFTAADTFTNGYAIVGVENGYGVIDKTGMYTVAPQFERLSWVSDGILSYQTQDSNLYGLCDVLGSILSEAKFQSLYSSQEYIWGQVDEGEDCYCVYYLDGSPVFGKGTNLSQIQYIYNNSYGQPYLAECTGSSEPNRYGFKYSNNYYSTSYRWNCYLTQDFQLLTNEPYQDAREFNETGCAVVSVRQDEWGHTVWGVIDNRGNYLCDLPEPDLGRAENWYIEANNYFALAAGYTGSYGMDQEYFYALVNLENNEITQYRSVKFMGNTDYIIVQDLDTNLYGLYDKNTMVKECVYDLIDMDSNNRIILKRGAVREIYEGDSN